MPRPLGIQSTTLIVGDNIVGERAITSSYPCHDSPKTQNWSCRSRKTDGATHDGARLCKRVVGIMLAFTLLAACTPAPNF